jgi:hypothetical protein
LGDFLGKGGERMVEEMKSKLQDSENSVKEYEVKIEGMTGEGRQQ